MHKSYQIYALIDPRDNSVRYVGFSRDAQLRLREHLNGGGGNGQERRWIHRLLKSGLSPILQVLETIEASEDALTIACERELYWIHEMARSGHPLLNVSGLSQPYIPPSATVYKPKRTWIPVIRKVSTTTDTDHSVNKPFISNKSRTLQEVYTVQEVAQNLKVSERTVRNWIESGELPAFPIGKRGYRISKADLQVFIDERKKRILDSKDDRE
jgi:excisionase family DNA binding protein